MSYKSDCLKIFSGLPAEMKEKIGGFEATRIIGNLEEQYKIQLKFLVILTAIGEVRMKDIPEYLIKKYGLSQENALAIKQELLKNVFSRILIEEDIDNLVDYAPEIRDIFQKGMLKIITGDEEEITELNEKTILSFSAGDLLEQAELINLIFNNQEELGSKQFVLNGRQAKPTIANWLKDFIQQVGVEMFDNLVLSNFITNSPNASILDSNERELLRKLLLTYRNLKFFPESMGDLPAEQWQIIPYQREEELIKTVARPAIEAPTPTFMSSEAPGFHFHPEDEAEAGKFKPSPAVIAHQMNWPELVEEIVKQANLGLADEVLIKRLKNIILLNLRDIRDSLETKDALIRPVKVGGLGLDENKADEILMLIRNKGQALPKKFKELADKRAQTEAEMIQSAEKKKVEDFQRRQRELAEHIRANAEITKQKLAAKLDVSHELPPPPPALFKQPTKRPVSQPIRPIAPPVRKEIPVRPPQPNPPAGGVGPKPRLQDVRTSPKLVGPLEELKNLNLVDFRRLSNNPPVAVDKIKQQIDLLERDSFAKRLAGIKAWRNSGLYRLYLDIGRQSIITGRLVKEIIAERQKANQPTLTEAEFEAVMDLNKSLRF